MSETMQKMWQADTLRAAQSELFGSSVLQAWRVDQLETFLKMGFPSQRQEAWKYTSLNEIAAQEFVLSPASPIDIPISHYAIKETYRIVFVNGCYSPALSDLAGINDDIIIECGDLAFQNETFQSILERHIKDARFSALNAAFSNDAFFCRLPRNICLNRPIHILHLNTETDEKRINHPRHVIIAEENSEAVIVEEFQGIGSARYFNNVVTQMELEPNARIVYYKWQNESPEGFHIANIDIHQAASSELKTFHIATGAKLNRDNWCYSLEGRAATCESIGLYYTQASQHIDVHSRIDHRFSNTSSRQVYKGIVTDKSRAVFNGKVIVHPNLSQVSADQSNNNLLLSDAAEVDAKPELEIYSDDVRCTHGATVGQLDSDALFYLQSRGIVEFEAKCLLTYAFIDEILDALPNVNIASKIKSHIINRLLSVEKYYG